MLFWTLSTFPLEHTGIVYFALPEVDLLLVSHSGAVSDVHAELCDSEGRSVEV